MESRDPYTSGQTAQAFVRKIFPDETSCCVNNNKPLMYQIGCNYHYSVAGHSTCAVTVGDTQPIIAVFLRQEPHERRE